MIDKLAENEVKTILDTSIKVKVKEKRKKWFKVVEIEREFKVIPFKFAQILRVFDRLDKYNVDVFVGTDIEIFNRLSVEDAVYIIGVTLHDNPREEPPKSLLNMIRNSMDVDDFIKIILIMLQQMNLSNFTSGIALLKGINPQKVNPTIKQEGDKALGKQ